MAYRTLPLASQEYYHIYNRGVARQSIFHNKRDFERFLFTIFYYRFQTPPFKLSRLLQIPLNKRKSTIEQIRNSKKKIVDILTFVLMPNHFHILLQQLEEDGISNFMRKSLNSYSRYFNTKKGRVGPLFQGNFKAVHIKTDNQLIHVSRYIHLNPLVSHVIREKDFISYPWSSFKDYIKGKSTLVNIDSILTYFSSPKKYKEFVLNQADYAKKFEEIKHITLEGL